MPDTTINWAEAPERIQFGAGMMEGLIELSKDETARLYVHKAALPLVPAALQKTLGQAVPSGKEVALPPLPTPVCTVRVSLSDATRLPLFSQAQMHARYLDGVAAGVSIAEHRSGLPAGFKLLKDSTHEERSWPEDASHENGVYSCVCGQCGRQFVGHKRRPVCRVCATTPPAAQKTAAQSLLASLDGLRMPYGKPGSRDVDVRDWNAAIDRCITALAAPAQSFGDMTGVSPCCGEYATCHRPCTPRGRWQATAARSEWNDDDPDAATKLPGEPVEQGEPLDDAALVPRERPMNLPDGKTCNDCVHCRRCCAIFGHIPADEVCDWYPSRFQAVVKP